MNETYEIRKVKNGYCIFEGGYRGPSSIMESPYVFETLDNALNFLRYKYSDIENNDKAPSRVGKE